MRHPRNLSLSFDSEERATFDRVHPSLLPASLTLSSSQTSATILPLHRQDSVTPSHSNFGDDVNEKEEVDEKIQEDCTLDSSSGFNTVPLVCDPASHCSEPSSKIAVSSKRLGLFPDIGEEVRDLVGVTSNEFQRYDRNVELDRVYYDQFFISPLEINYNADLPPVPWERYVHPEGAPYYLNASEYIPVLTDVDVYDNNQLTKLERCIKDIFAFIEKYQISLPKDAQLVLEHRLSERWGYYFVDHSRQCLFWLEEFDAMVFLSGVNVKYSRGHLGLAMRSLYWMHHFLFPRDTSKASDATAELKDILIHSIGDLLTSSTSTALYTLEDSKSMLSLAKEIQSEERIGSGSACVVYRLLSNLYDQRFINLYGEKGTRLNSDQSVHRPQPRSRIWKLIAPLVWYASDVYFNRIRKISVDSIVKKAAWTILVKQLTDEWNSYILFATVLLNSNVGFLAIQSIDEAGSPGHRSIPQRSSYISIVLSLSVIVLGLLFIRQHNDSSVFNRLFICNRSKSVDGLDTLALMYSLPYALLIWAMISFFVAFSSACYLSTDVPTIVIMSLTWFMFCCLLLWCISVAYEKNYSRYGPWIFRQFRSFRRPVFNALVTEDVGRLESSPGCRISTLKLEGSFNA